MKLVGLQPAVGSRPGLYVCKTRCNAETTIPTIASTLIFACGLLIAGLESSVRFGNILGRVAKSVSAIFLFDAATRGEDTTFVNHRGVTRRGAPPEEKQIQNCFGKFGVSHPTAG